MSVLSVKCPVCERDIVLDYTVEGGRYKEPAMIEWVEFCSCGDSSLVNQQEYYVRVMERASEAWGRCEDEDVD
jgi:hypothetical protein